MQVSLSQQVWIDLKPASFSSRSLAFMMDFFLRWSAFALLAITLVYISAGGIGISILEEWFDGQSTVIASFLILSVFIMELSYPIYFDLAKDGVSPGKRVMGLRVVDESGLPITYKASFIRNIFTILDIMPGAGTVAMFSMMLTKNSKRLGDIVAGTLVVYELGEGLSSSDASLAKDSERLTVLPLKLYNILESYLRRADQLSKDGRETAVKDIIDIIDKHCPSVSVPVMSELAVKEKWIENLYRSSRPSKMTVAKSKEDITIDWAKIKDKLQESRKKLLQLENKSRIDAVGLAGIAESFQELCQTYAHLTTFYPDTIEALQAAKLVRLGRRLIYSRRLSRRETDPKSYQQKVVEGFFAIKWYILFAATLGVTGAVAAAAIVQLDHSLVWNFLSEEIAGNLSQGKLWTDNIHGIGDVAASQIMTNNIKVTILAFVLGITGGVGTACVLLVNGLHLGGTFAALAYYGMGGRLFEFIVAHGFLELSVIAVAGGTGLYLGDALVRPKSLTRFKALQNHANTVFHLISFNMACLVVAGLVEGLISPSPLIPFAPKLVLGMLLGAAYWKYLTFREYNDV